MQTLTNLPKFISIHIPKAGGVTFFHILKKIYGKRILHDNAMSPLNPLCPGRLYAKNWGKYHVIHGHFDYSKYEHLPLITWVRNPIDRVISHYCYWKFRRVTAAQRTNNFYHELMIARKLDIYQFAELLPNVITTFVGEDISKYTFIGIVEEFEHSLKRFKEWSGLEITGYERKNVNVKIPENFIENIDRERIAQFVKKDMYIYDMAYDKYIRKVLFN